MLILRFPSQTNYRLEAPQAKRIGELWEMRRK
jgi:hypothetical protein